MLCDSCNKDRLGTSNIVRSTIRSYGRINQSSNRGLNNKEKDEEFYESLWNSKPHYCEECNEFLGDDFKDENGNIINRFRYSHILPKGGAYAVFRHRLENGNLLCLRDHNKWEHGIRTDMKIYPSNKIVMDNFIQELIEINGKGRKRV